MAFLIKTLIAAVIISFASWLASKRPNLAGFILALPVPTLLVLLFSFVEYREPASSIQFAKSIFFAVPLSLTFFIPFLFAERFNLSFWSSYTIGISFLIAGFFIHKAILQY